MILYFSTSAYPYPPLTSLSSPLPPPYNLSLPQAFQKQLGARNSSLNSVLKAGNLLLKQKEGEDAVVLQNKLDRAQQMWDSVCQKSVDRQQKLQVRKRSKRARVKVQRSKAIHRSRCMGFRG